MNHIKAYETHLRESGKSIKTIESYTGDVAGYIRFLAVSSVAGSLAKVPDAVNFSE